MPYALEGAETEFEIAPTSRGDVTKPNERAALVTHNSDDDDFFFDEEEEIGR